MLKQLPSLFRYYKNLGERTFEQLEEDQLCWSPGEESNSIAIIVNHLSGNMLSRFTNFLTEDGEKPWRDRESEFATTSFSRGEILAKWNEGWNCLFDTLASLKQSDMDRIVYIRNEGHTAEEAIHRQLAHCAYHIGQIVFIGRMLKGDQWQSLSIPRGLSDSFNQQMFDKAKGIRHFTKELNKK